MCKVSFFIGQSFQCSRSTIAELYDKICLVLWKTTKRYTKVVVSFVFLPFINWSSCCSTSSPRIDDVSILRFNHFNMCVMVSRSCFNFQFPNEKWYWTSFQCLFAISISSLVTCSVILPIFNLAYVFVYCWVWRALCIFWTPVLYQICVSQIFSLSLWFDLLFS